MRGYRAWVRMPRVQNDIGRAGVCYVLPREDFFFFDAKVLVVSQALLEHIYLSMFG